MSRDARRAGAVLSAVLLSLPPALRAGDAPPPAGPTPDAAADAPAPAAKPAAPPADSTRPDIVVTGTREPAEALAVPAHVTVLTAEEIARSGWRDVAEALAAPAGLFERRNSTTPQDITIDLRGFNNGGGNGQRMLVLVDGRKTNSVTGSSTDWASIPLQNIERIEIVRGPAAALYGDTAVGGVVHILTRDGSKPFRALAAEAGSYGTFRERAVAAGAEGDLSYAAYGSLERSDGFRDNSGYDGQDATLRLGLALDDAWRIRAKAGYHHDDRRRPGTLTKNEIALYGRDATVTPCDRCDVLDTNADVGVERRRTAFLKGAGDVDERTFAFATWSRDRTDSANTIVGVGDTDLVDKSDLLNLNLQHTSVFRLLDRDAADVKATAGADLGYERTRSRADNDEPPWFWVNTEDVSYRRHLLGLYAHGELALTDALAASGGVRFDRALFDFRRAFLDETGFTGDSYTTGRRSFDQWNPHAGVNYRWGAATSTYAAWGRTMRYPNRDELTGMFGFTPELAPERASTWEIGLREEWGRSFSGTLALYRMDVKDEILYVPPPLGAAGMGSNQNVARIRHQGLEASFRGEVAKPVSVLGSYTFTQTEILNGPFEGGLLPLTPPHEGMIGLDVAPLDWLLFTARCRIVGSRYYINDPGNAHERLPDYAVVDLGVRIQVDRVQAWATLYNAANRKYFENGALGGNPFGSREAFNPAPGINFMAGAQVEF